jgi:hypothetical protein
MKRILLLLVAGFLAGPLYSQLTFWEAFFGGNDYDEGKRVVFRPDGTLVVAAETHSTDGIGKDNHSFDTDIVIFKYSTQGIFFWERTIGGSGPDQLSDMIETRDGGYALIGTSESHDGDIRAVYGKTDIWVAKLDGGGRILWSKTYGGSGNDKGISLVETFDGGFLIVGESGSRDGTMRSERKGGLDSWVARLHPDGRLVWEKHYGGTHSDSARRIHEIGKDKFLVINASDSKDGDVLSPMGKKDAWVFCIDLYGTFNWQTSFGGPGFDDVHASCKDKEGNIVIAGTTFSESGQISEQKGEGDFWLFKISPEGRLLWSRTYGGSKADGANGVCATRDGGYLICGMSKSTDGDIMLNQGYYDALVVKTDHNGEIRWSWTFGFGGKDAFNSILEIPQGGYLATGFAIQDDKSPRIPNHIAKGDIWLMNFGDPLDRNIRPFITPPALTGTIRDEKTGEVLSAQIILTDNESLDSLATTWSNPETGFFILLLPTYGLVSINVLKKGYLFYGEDIELDTVVNRTSIRREIALQPIHLGARLVLSRIYFDTGKWNLLRQSNAELERLVAFLNLNPRVSIQINGHTDNTGNKNDKKKLSLNRANAVRQYLLKRDIPEWRMRVKGYGMYQPVAPNSTEEGRRKNRRVEFIVLSM